METSVRCHKRRNEGKGGEDGKWTGSGWRPPEGQQVLDGGESRLRGGQRTRTLRMD